jgi:hypothetical protein
MALSKPMSSTALACLAVDLRERPEELATALLQHGDGGQLRNNLGAVRVDPDAWYGIAQLVKPRNHDLALSVLALVEKAGDTDGAMLAVLERYTLLSTRGDRAGADALRNRLVALATSNGRKLAVLGAALPSWDTATRAMICGAALDPTITWACAEALPGSIATFVPAIAALPFLSFADLARLRAIDPHGRLPGLACESPKELDPAALEHGHVDAQPEEVTIYQRLSRDAPSPVSQCLLEQAAAACISVIRHGQPCPQSSVLADYIRLLTPAQQTAATQQLFIGKTAVYSTLHRHDDPLATSVLFYLHLALAEIVLDSEPKPTGWPSRFWTPQYHISRAMDLSGLQVDSTSEFAGLLGERLREEVCNSGAQMCARRCTLTWSSSDCVQLCNTDTAKIASVCHRKPSNGSSP